MVYFDFYRKNPKNTRVKDQKSDKNQFARPVPAQPQPKQTNLTKKNTFLLLSFPFKQMGHPTILVKSDIFG